METGITVCRYPRLEGRGYLSIKYANAFELCVTCEEPLEIRTFYGFLKFLHWIPFTSSCLCLFSRGLVGVLTLAFDERYPLNCFLKGSACFKYSLILLHVAVKPSYKSEVCFWSF